MHRWTIALAACALLASACGTSRPAAGPENGGGGTAATGSPSPTTESTADTAGGSGTGDTDGGTGAPGRWDTPCRETKGSAAPTKLAYDGVSDRFGPLGPAALLDVTLPTVAAVLPDDDRQVQAQAAVVNGGVVLSVAAGRGQPEDASVVAVVDRGGTRRWVRCLPGDVLDVWAAAPRLQPATVLVALFPSGVAPETQWALLALDTGETVPGFADGAAAAGLDAAAQADAMVVAESPSSVLIGSRDQAGGHAVMRYDLVAGTFTPIPPPPDGFGDRELALGPDDEVVVGYADGRGVTAVFDDGTWRTDEASRLAARPTEVGFDWGGSGALQAVDGTGRLLWRNTELVGPALEGVAVITDGAVTVANVCTAPDPGAGVCNRYETVGVDAATGAVPWRLEGLRGVVAADDGWALLTDAGQSSDGAGPEVTGWVLLDDRTGTAAAPDQRWALGAFGEGCCGEIEIWTEQVGGVVLAAAPGHLRVWYPSATDGSPTTVSLL